MAKEDLLEHAKSSVDFYELLGVTFTSSESDIRRAYRKTALKYHPDKLGAAFDPEKFHLLQVANDVLSDPAAKAVYDQGRQAKILREEKDRAFEGERRRMKEDLEERERRGSTAFGGSGGASAGMKRAAEGQQAVDLQRLREAGKRRRLAEEEKRRAAGENTPAKAVPIHSPAEPVPSPSIRKVSPTAEEEAAEEDEIARLERRIKEARAAKEQKRAEKKARKSGIFIPSDSPAPSPVFRASTAKTTFASSPSVATTTPSKIESGNGGFAATMERLREAERRRLEEQIRKEEEAEELAK